MVIDHCEEHTIRLALDEGYWAGMTLYPTTNATPERAADMIEIYGAGADLGHFLGRLGPVRSLGRRGVRRTPCAAAATANP